MAYNKKEKKSGVSYTSFPSDIATDAEKKTEAFGLEVGKAISFEWFRRDGSNGMFYDRWRDFHRLRLYARGEQSINKYKNEIAVDGDLSYMNLDFTPVPIIPKFVDVVVNGMSDRLFKVKAYAQDAMSQAKRSAYQDMLESEMASREILQKVQKELGVNPFVTPPEDLPESDEELSLHMQLKYKPAIEIAEEEAINTVFAENHYDDIRPRINYDLTVLGKAVAKHEFLKGSGVQVSYCDVASVIHSYTEDPYFRDCYYWGEVKVVPITELYKINPDITEDEIEEIKQSSSGWIDEYGLKNIYDNSLFSQDVVSLLYYNYKTTEKVVFKKKLIEGGGKRVIKKDDTFNPPEEVMSEGRFEKIEKIIDVWYDGIMVLGCEKVIKWEKSENMVRPKSSSQHALPNYVACAPRMYKGNIDSLVRRMIPFADLIQITHLKLMQVIQKVVPDGVFIDADGIVEVDLGNGQAYNPQDALQLYFQTGSVIGRSMTTEGEFNHARIPIQELNKNTGAGKAEMLIMSYNHYLNSIRDVTGLNEARDGSMPDPNSLVGLQKLAALNSNTATRHILDGSLFITRSLAEALTYRVSDILQYADFKDDFANKIGKYNVGLLNEIKDLYIYDFGIFIEVAPDEEEKAQLEANINMALSKGDINLEDAIDIREVKNIKLANQLLKLKRVRKIQADQAFAREQQMIQSETQMQIQQMAAQTKQMEIEAETNSKIKIKQAESMYDIERMREEARLKEGLMDREFEYKKVLTGLEQEGLGKREQQREEAKDKRVKAQSSDQSRLINQRKNNLPPMNFESNEDTLDGINMGQIGI
jgi:hypothetical protein